MDNRRCQYCGSSENLVEYIKNDGTFGYDCLDQESCYERRGLDPKEVGLNEKDLERYRLEKDFRSRYGNYNKSRYPTAELDPIFYVNFGLGHTLEYLDTLCRDLETLIHADIHEQIKLVDGVCQYMQDDEAFHVMQLPPLLKATFPPRNFNATSIGNLAYCVLYAPPEFTKYYESVYKRLKDQFPVEKAQIKLIVVDDKDFYDGPRAFVRVRRLLRNFLNRFRDVYI